MKIPRLQDPELSQGINRRGWSESLERTEFLNKKTQAKSGGGVQENIDTTEYVMERSLEAETCQYATDNTFGGRTRVFDVIPGQEKISGTSVTKIPRANKHVSSTSSFCQPYRGAWEQCTDPPSESSKESVQAQDTVPMGPDTCTDPSHSSNVRDSLFDGGKVELVERLWTFLKKGPGGPVYHGEGLGIQEARKARRFCPEAGG